MSVAATTLKDIARRCQVSVATVSKVLNPGNEQYRISKATRDQVLAVCSELGFRPNRQARALRQGRSFRVGVVVDQFGPRKEGLPERDPERHRDGYDFSAPVVIGMLASAGARQLDVQAVNRRPGDPDTAAVTAVSLLHEGRIDGVVLPIGSSFAPRMLAATGRPVISIGGRSHHFTGITCLAIDLAPALAHGVAHLAALGHRSIAYLGPQPDGSSASGERWAVVEAQCRERGLGCRQMVVPDGFEGGYSSAREESNAARIAELCPGAGPPASAVICYNENTAMALYRLAAQRGWRVPDDLAVIGVDDIHARGMSPGLTSVTNMSMAVGRAALELMADLLDGRADPAAEHRVAAELVIRASTAPAGDLTS